MYCVVHYVWFCEFWMQIAIASIVHLYVFPAKPYELMGDHFTESISVLGDYSANCPYEFDVMFKLFIFHKVSVLHSGNFVYWVCYFFVICLRWSDILLWQLLQWCMSWNVSLVVVLVMENLKQTLLYCTSSLFALVSFHAMHEKY